MAWDSSGMKQKIKDAQQSMPQRIMAALYAEVQLMATEAKRRCPFDTGNLRATIHVVKPTRDGDKISTQIVAGGTAAPYAVYVHENTTAHHEHGQAKFIESVIDESLSTLGGRIAARVDLAAPVPTLIVAEGEE